MKKLVLLLVLAAVPLSANYWCDPNLKTPEQRFAAADAVFIGTAEKVNMSPARGGAAAEFIVTHVLKGPVKAHVRVAYGTGSDSAIEFRQGKTYLIYVVGDAQDGWMTGAACGTQPISK